MSIVCVHSWVRSRDLKGESDDPLELESQAIVSHLTWVLGTQLRSLVRAVGVLNGSVIQPATDRIFA